MELEKRTNVSICVLTHNRCSILKDLLLSLKELKYEPLEIIVVDNHSTDNTKQMIIAEFQDVNYIRTTKNIGATARNLGLKGATGAIIITLDDDIIGVNDNDIINIVNYFKNRPNLAALNFKILDYSTGDLSNWIHHCDPDKYSNKELLTYEITEGAVALRKSALERSGYYPDNFFLSHEGPDLAFRLIDIGYDVIYSNTVTVKHHHSDLGRSNWLNYYYDTRNQLWLAARHFPLSYSISYLSRGLFSMLVYSIRDGFLLYWLKAIIDGLKGLKITLEDRHALSNNTMKLIRGIDGNRENMKYHIINKLFKKGVRL